jgi:hypothetical protein
MLFSSLETFLTTLREEKEFKNFEMEAIKMCGSNVYKKVSSIPLQLRAILYFDYFIFFAKLVNPYIHTRL